MAHFTWDDLPYFLAVTRSGQLSRAARQLRTSHVTVARRIERLEASLGVRLFERNPRGYEVTPAGRQLIETAERMEEEAERIQVALSSEVSGQSGTLRLAAPEGFSHFFSNNLLARFAARFPRITLELITLTQVIALSRREAEISISLDPIKSATYHSERLAEYTLGVYGSPARLAAGPPIAGRDDLTAHSFCSYIEEMLFAPALDYLREVQPAIRAGFKSSSIFNQMAAAKHGLGLCVLPRYLAEGDPDLVAVLPAEITLRRSYFINCHRDLQQSPRERSVMAFLREEIGRLGAQLMR